MSELTFNQRFKKILQHYDLKSAEAARRMNVNRQVTDSYLKDSLPRLDMLVALLKTFPELNINWVIFGNGDMLKLENNEIGEPSGKYAVSAELEILKKYWESDREELSKLREQNRQLIDELLNLRGTQTAKAAG